RSAGAGARADPRHRPHAGRLQPLQLLRLLSQQQLSAAHHRRGIGAMTARHASVSRARGGASLPLEPLVTLCAMLAVVALLTVSSTLLTARGVHYLTSGGAFYEKLHPATYFIVLAC